ncbi:riboflavin kinase [Apostasia shenzhenica]|uniref:Riboflavin kinase n=1 Tax=Apostasia shenzhenica TaxID=1088818 RepID=A0A2I0ACG8_9ASPA|nr:riboflavin kinase [Apostasia shenzhenica]
MLSRVAVRAAKDAEAKVAAVPSLQNQAERYLIADRVLHSLLEFQPEILGLPPFEDLKLYGILAHKVVYQWYQQFFSSMKDTPFLLKHLQRRRHLCSRHGKTNRNPRMKTTACNPSMAACVAAIITQMNISSDMLPKEVILSSSKRGAPFSPLGDVYE